MDVNSIIENEYKKILIENQIIKENDVKSHFTMRLGQRVFCDPKHKCIEATITDLPKETKKEIMDNISFLKNRRAKFLL